MLFVFCLAVAVVLAEPFKPTRYPWEPTPRATRRLSLTPPRRRWWH